MFGTDMNTVREIEAAISRLTFGEVEELLAWIDDYLEGQMDLNEDVKAKLAQSNREIVSGNYRVRISKNQSKKKSRQ